MHFDSMYLVLCLHVATNSCREFSRVLLSAVWYPGSPPGTSCSPWRLGCTSGPSFSLPTLYCSLSLCFSTTLCGLRALCCADILHGALTSCGCYAVPWMVSRRGQSNISPCFRRSLLLHTRQILIPAKYWECLFWIAMTKSRDLPWFFGIHIFLPKKSFFQLLMAPTFR